MFRLSIGRKDEVHYSKDLITALLQCRDGVREGTEGLTPFKGCVHSIDAVRFEKTEHGAELVIVDGPGKERIRLFGAGTEDSPYQSVRAVNLLRRFIKDEPECRRLWAEEKAREQADKAAKAEKAKAFSHRPGRAR